MKNMKNHARLLRGVLAAALLLIVLLGTVGCGCHKSEPQCKEPTEETPKTRAIPDPMLLE